MNLGVIEAGKTSANQQHRFTLVELLVVVFILSVLMAFMLPMLAGSLHAARLVSCANTQKQIALGVLSYAGENRQRWPSRGASRSSPAAGGSWVWNLRNKGGSSSMHYDDRPVLSQAFSINELQCPFVPARDLEGATNNFVGDPYAFFFGWRYEPPEKRMRRVGQTFTYGGSQFDVIVADFNMYKSAQNRSDASHPDYRVGAMEVINWNGDWCSSFYRLEGIRTPIDLSFARSDGSVFTIRDVEYDDKRLKKVPVSRDGDLTNYLLCPEVGYRP